jgi:hypothetical protein
MEVSMMFSKLTLREALQRMLERPHDHLVHTRGTYWFAESVGGPGDLATYVDTLQAQLGITLDLLVEVPENEGPGVAYRCTLNLPSAEEPRR